MLPVEIIFDVVREAWLTMVEGHWADRWDFYRSISMVSPSFNDAIQNAALRNITIATTQEFAKYRHLVRCRWGIEPGDGDNERVDPSAAAYFAQSEMHIVIAGWAYASSFHYETAFDPQKETDYALIPRYIPACRHVHVLITASIPSDRLAVPYQSLFRLLSQYPRTCRLSLRWASTHTYRLMLPADFAAAGVTYLRVHYLPRCICHDSPLPPHGKRHHSDCFSYLFPTLFPQLQHLHIDTPYFLKNLATPSNLTLVTIEAPPIFYTPLHGPFSSLSAWNIVSGLALGFFRPRANLQAKEAGEDASLRPPPRRRKIVVNTGPQEPQGWVQAAAACKKHGVELEWRHKYRNPTRRAKDNELELKLQIERYYSDTRLYLESLDLLIN